MIKRKNCWVMAVSFSIVLILLGVSVAVSAKQHRPIQEITLNYPVSSKVKLPKKLQESGSTHELTYNPNMPNKMWITGQNYAQVAEIPILEGGVTEDDVVFHDMPDNSGPHGIDFDEKGQLWVTLEFAGQVVRLDANGNIDQRYDVQLDCDNCKRPINTHPHGLGIDPDGRTVWYTGKATGTVGKISPEVKVENFPITTVDDPEAGVGTVPIYIKAGPDGNMWFTELVGNAIGRITSDGKATEFPIPTANSRPISITQDPVGSYMWFTEESGNNVGRIDMEGNITEFPIPKSQEDVILAALSFDRQNNLWVQQYVGDTTDNKRNSFDHIIKIDQSILTAQTAAEIDEIPFTFYRVPTRHTVMHRIIEGPNGDLWSTELNTNKIAKVLIAHN